MRVIAGTAKGHNLKCVDGQAVRPTTDKVKGAVFSMLGPCVYGARVLDLFSGSGALGIEALSRGAQSAAFVDASKDAARVINENLVHTKLIGKASVFLKDAFAFLEETQGPFDLIFLDPPYRGGLLERTLLKIGTQNLLAPGALVVAERDRREPFTLAPFYEMQKDKNYGRVGIMLLRQSEKNEMING